MNGSHCARFEVARTVCRGELDWEPCCTILVRDAAVDDPRVNPDTCHVGCQDFCPAPEGGT